MRLFSGLASSLSLASLGLGGLVAATSISSTSPRRDLLQDIVTFDEHSVLIRGERLFLYSGEFHPFRLPVPGLWLDVLQKIKALGFNTVSFYVDWALVEGSRGTVRLDGIFGLQAFFDAATEAGLYVIARPGPYINAETSAGGLPGWTLRIPCRLRAGDCAEYINGTSAYLAAVGQAIAAAQITNGGPVILVQPENEYSTWPDVDSAEFPTASNRANMVSVEQQLRDAGIVVPFLSNDNVVAGYWAPGTGAGEVDLYGIDAYPMRYNCAAPDVWPTIRWPTDWQLTHARESPTTPFAIAEFQGGSGTGFGSGVTQDGCAALVGPAALRVVYKHNYAFGVKLLNIYMAYGGVNWGNLGYMGGDSAYDYGAAIDAYRQVAREKYSEQKLQANFFRVSPAYLTAAPGNDTNGTWASTAAINTTPLYGANGTNLYVVRQANWTSVDSVSYTMRFRLGHAGTPITVPQLGGGQLSLLGRDSKLMVTEYDVGGVSLVYSTADIFTWATSAAGNKRVLILYGTEGELHEFALPLSAGRPTLLQGRPHTGRVGQTHVVQWTVTRAAQTVLFDDVGLEVRLLWRNDAYTYWVLELPAAAPVGNHSSPSKQHVVVKGGYLMRTARIDDAHTLHLTGDFNATTDVELVFEPTGSVDRVTVNGHALVAKRRRGHGGGHSGTVAFAEPALRLPDLTALSWRAVDALPELAADYDDSRWTDCDHTRSTNDQITPLRTPTSLFASDYGYHGGSLLYRGHFVATGTETALFLNVSGGSAFAYSAWLNDTFLGSYVGSASVQCVHQTLDLPAKVVGGVPCVVTILIDHMGQDEEAPGTDAVKFPQGILDYRLEGSDAPMAWKMTGNLGGEDYRDTARGPRNEGALFAERQGYHLPQPPTAAWPVRSPFTKADGLSVPGVAFYAASFDLDMPHGYDIPLGLAFANNTAAAAASTEGGGAYRVQLFVNGYQFGKFVPYLGPVFTFAVPQGVLDYRGTNYVALSVWALEPGGAVLGGLTLQPQSIVQSSMREPGRSPMPAWTERAGAY